MNKELCIVIVLLIAQIAYGQIFDTSQIWQITAGTSKSESQSANIR